MRLAYGNWKDVAEAVLLCGLISLGSETHKAVSIADARYRLNRAGFKVPEIACPYNPDGTQTCTAEVYDRDCDPSRSGDRFYMRPTYDHCRSLGMIEDVTSLVPFSKRPRFVSRAPGSDAEAIVAKNPIIKIVR